MDELKPITITWQLAARSVNHSMGILEDVPIKVGKFVIPGDFIVLDMKKDSQIPIILGRPFLATISTIIDVKNGKLFLTVGAGKVKFDLANAVKKSFVEGSYCRIDMLQQVIRQKIPKHYSKDPIERCLVCDELADVEDDESGEYEHFLEAQPYIQP